MIYNSLVHATSIDWSRWSTFRKRAIGSGPLQSFIGDLGFAPILYDAAHDVIVAGDASGSLHILSVREASD